MNVIRSAYHSSITCWDNWEHTKMKTLVAFPPLSTKKHFNKLTLSLEPPRRSMINHHQSWFYSCWTSLDSMRRCLTSVCMSIWKTLKSKSTTKQRLFSTLRQRRCSHPAPAKSYLHAQSPKLPKLCSWIPNLKKRWISLTQVWKRSIRSVMRGRTLLLISMTRSLALVQKT